LSLIYIYIYIYIAVKLLELENINIKGKFFDHPTVIKCILLIFKL